MHYGGAFITLNKPIDAVTVKDKMLLKRYLKQLLIPGYSVKAPTELRRKWEQLAIEPADFEIIEGDWPMGFPYYILFRHGDYHLSEDSPNLKGLWRQFDKSLDSIP